MSTAPLMEAFGGLGLFLLGMWLMTEGLRLAAGPALERLLASWTRNRLRGLLSGVTITALVQSSSAVTVATLGFVNAGLLDFRRAVWVIFGSNVGTTLTAWLVAIVGFKLKVDALALPLVGVGALLRVFAPRVRLQHLGMALAGFGVLFLGIDVLASGFAAVGERISLPGGVHPAAMVLVGALLTTLMQSSSAAIALILTAVAGGVVGLADAAAGVIGANIGTTTTALIATLGATAPARRLAMAHVFFNLVTGGAALIVLPAFLALVSVLAGQPSEPAMTLAAFHTGFNLLGVALMLPMEPPLSRWLQGRFRTREAQSAELHYLDSTVAAVPHLAERALVMELEVLLHQYPAALEGVAKDPGASVSRSRARRQQLDRLADFLMVLSRGALGDEQSRQLARAWRVQQNLANAEDALTSLAGVLGQLDVSEGRSLRKRLEHWLGQLAAALPDAAGNAGGDPPEADFESLAGTYEQVKMDILATGVGGAAPRRTLDQALQGCSQSRRLAEQWLRACNGVRALSRPDSVSADEMAREARQPPAENPHTAAGEQSGSGGNNSEENTDINATTLRP